MVDLVEEQLVDQAHDQCRKNRAVVISFSPPPLRRIKKRNWADGSCSRLVDGKCSIYSDRPTICRMFDCRVYLLTGIPSGDPIMAEAVTAMNVVHKEAN